jgi:hypothetical protein
MRAAPWDIRRLDDGVACPWGRAHRCATLAFIPAHPSATDPRPALPACAYPHVLAVLAAPVSDGMRHPLEAGRDQVARLLDVREGDGQCRRNLRAPRVVGQHLRGALLGDDVSPPEARVLRWHSGTTAEALRDSRAACPASGEWSRRLLADPFLADEVRCRRRHVTASRERSACAALRARLTATHRVMPAMSHRLRGCRMSNAPGAAVP